MLLKVQIILIILVLGARASNFGLKTKNPKKDQPIKWVNVQDAFKKVVDSFFSKNIRKLFEISRTLNISSDCRSTLMEAVMAFRKMEQWPFLNNLREGLSTYVELQDWKWYN
ncbi:hypothetical protein CDAR_46521 [Caerostris darwini]|uniref:Uncharacterized protein n=1 Tax=Caerostris darwini TaxID=1538125 RepID=A0AAV4W763_9ARAC|nr:hypothetical protein CDAR_46521 [Caerostris darwini]